MHLTLLQVVPVAGHRPLNGQRAEPFVLAWQPIEFLIEAASCVRSRLADDRLDEAWPELDAGARLREDDVEAQWLTALTAAAEGHDDHAFEMLERARLRAEGTDVLTVNEVEERMHDSPEAARRLLQGTLAPSALRERLAARP